MPRVITLYTCSWGPGWPQRYQRQAPGHEQDCLEVLLMISGRAEEVTYKGQREEVILTIVMRGREEEREVKEGE